MKKLVFFIPVISLSLLSACATPEISKWVTPEPGSIDQNVLKLLPVGSYEVSGEFRKEGKTFTALKGYVNFGTEADGSDCEADYTLSNLNSNLDETLPSDVQTIHPLGGPAWYRDVTDKDKPGSWSDISNPGSERIPWMFIPTIISDGLSAGVVEGAGTGEICSIPTIARFMKMEGNTLIFDMVRTQSTVNASIALWVERFIDSTGLTGGERDKYIKIFTGITNPSYSNLIQGVSLTISQTKNGEILIRQLREANENFEVFILLTPTNARVVEQINEEDYFEKVKDEVKNSRLSIIEYLEKEYL
jgi:hypothetical protein